MSDESTGTAGTPDEHDDAQDPQLLTALGEMFDRVDPPPAWLVELSKASYDLRSIDLEFAQLVADSRVDAPAVAVRSTALATEPRMLTFESDDLSIDIEVTPDRAGRQTVVGQLLPEQSARVELHQPGRPAVDVPVDEFGRFIVEGVEPGAFSLVCHRPDRRAIASPWVAPD